jgi:RNA polymerase sigma-70 factor (ECF subfamily)
MARRDTTGGEGDCDAGVPQPTPFLTTCAEETELIRLFTTHRDRLRRMVQIRIDRRLQGRIDDSDVLQEAHLDVARRAREYLDRPTMSPYLWLRYLTAQRLAALHRKHLGARMRDAGREVARHGATPEASSLSMVELLVSQHTSPTLAAQRAEIQRQLQEALDGMDPIDREALTLRHFEELTNAEVAELLGLSKQAASKRYVQALKRLKAILSQHPEWLEG